VLSEPNNFPCGLAGISRYGLARVKCPPLRHFLSGDQAPALKASPGKTSCKTWHPLGFIKKRDNPWVGV